jgi:hypothetical protein
MKASNGAFSHFSILRLPWVAFQKYLQIINAEEREMQKARARERVLRKFSQNPAMVKDYQRNIEKWRKNQPPP